MNRTSSLSGTHHIASLTDLSELASRMAQELEAGDVLLLSGELGAGKTTFTQFLGKSLGVQDAITSPTYTLVGEYVVMDNPDISRLVHIDLYRTGDASALHDEYIQELVGSSTHNKAIIVIEWGELFRMPIENTLWRISLKPGKDTEDRIVTIE